MYFRSYRPLFFVSVCNCFNDLNSMRAYGSFVLHGSSSQGWQVHYTDAVAGASIDLRRSIFSSLEFTLILAGFLSFFCRAMLSSK